jgi:hypothetical protein
VQRVPRSRSFVTCLSASVCFGEKVDLPAAYLAHACTSAIVRPIRCGAAADDLSFRSEPVNIPLITAQFCRHTHTRNPQHRSNRLSSAQLSSAQSAPSTSARRSPHSGRSSPAERAVGPKSHRRAVPFRVRLRASRAPSQRLPRRVGTATATESALTTGTPSHGQLHLNDEEWGRAVCSGQQPTSLLSLAFACCRLHHRHQQRQHRKHTNGPVPSISTSPQHSAAARFRSPEQSERFGSRAQRRAGTHTIGLYRS